MSTKYQLFYMYYFCFTKYCNIDIITHFIDKKIKFENKVTYSFSHCYLACGLQTQFLKFFTTLGHSSQWNYDRSSISVLHTLRISIFPSYSLQWNCFLISIFCVYVTLNLLLKIKYIPNKLYKVNTVNSSWQNIFWLSISIENS